VPRPTPAADPLLRGELHLRHHGVGVRLVVGHGVFSAADIDPGTRFLLRWLATNPAVHGARRVLDLGCGYGPLGLWLAAAADARSVVAVDRDALAVECTALGAEANGIADRVAAHASLGYDDVEGPFDLIVSNIPAKVGGAALRHLLLDGALRLEPDGTMAIVVVDRLAPEVDALLGGEPAVEVLEQHRNRGYATWTYRFAEVPAAADPAPGFDRGVYRRESATFRAAGMSWTATTSFTLAEFDTLGRGTEAAVELIAGHALASPVAVVGVGQGHLALAVCAAGGAGAALRMVDRDLLALRTAGANLGSDDVELRHSARSAGQVEGCGSAIVGLPEKEPVAVTAALVGDAVAELPAGAPVVVHGRAADVSRVIDILGRRGRRLAVTERVSRPGFAAVLARA